MGPKRGRQSTGGDQKKRSSESSAFSASQLFASQLFEETVELSVEDGSSKDADKFASFIIDMLPIEVLETLKNMAGYDDDTAVVVVSTDRTRSSGGASDDDYHVKDVGFLHEVWMERFFVAPLEDNDALGLTSTENNTYECELCDRIISTTRHHVYPKETHIWLQSRDPMHYTDTILRTTINLCRMCHR